MEKNRFQRIIEEKRKEKSSKISKSSKKEAGTEPSRDEIIKKIYQHIIKQANIDPLFQDCTLDNFNTSILSEHNQEIAQKFFKYVKDISTAMKLPQSVYLYSKYPGIGKTHLAVAALKEAARQIAEEEYSTKETVRQGIFPYHPNWAPVYFLNVSEGLMDIKNDMDSSEKDFSQSQIYQNVKLSRLVVLDDIFNEIRFSPFVLETLLYWVDYRLKNNLATIFTSNHNFEIFLSEELTPITNERLKAVARNTASRVSKMVQGYRLALDSSPQTDYRRRY